MTPRRHAAPRPGAAQHVEVILVPASLQSGGQLAFPEPAVFSATQLSTSRLGITYGKIP
jgi:hypothetical protein